MHLGMMLQIDELSYIKIKTHMNKKNTHNHQSKKATTQWEKVLANHS